MATCLPYESNTCSISHTEHSAKAKERCSFKFKLYKHQSKFDIRWCTLLITDVTSFQASRRKRAEAGDVLKAAAIGTAVGGPVGGFIGAALCFAFCSGKPHLIPSINTTGHSLLLP